jgi:hypothetical protein
MPGSSSVIWAWLKAGESCLGNEETLLTKGYTDLSGDL